MYTVAIYNYYIASNECFIHSIVNVIHMGKFISTMVTIINPGCCSGVLVLRDQYSWPDFSDIRHGYQFVCLAQLKQGLGLASDFPKLLK